MPSLGIHAEYEGSDIAGYITHIPLRQKTFELVRSRNFVAYADDETPKQQRPSKTFRLYYCELVTIGL